MIREAYLSGEFQYRNFHRHIDVWKYCGRAIFRDGFKQAWDVKDIRLIEVHLNGKKLAASMYSFEGDRIIFKKPLLPKKKKVLKPLLKRLFSKEKYDVVYEPQSHYLHVKIVYNRMEGVEYAY